jgi:anti-sigma factor (TIGR02949 family)
MNDDRRPSGSQGRAAPEELSCEESLALVYEYLDGELASDWSEAVRDHLRKCKRCYPHFDFERMFLDYIHEAGSEAASNPELEDRVRALIASEDP